ncbi:MAG: hypothetical protein K0S36_2478 [Nitrosospira multiformis]|nr:hypothetical protein [Nitrosospira multiformis]
MVEVIDSPQLPPFTPSPTVLVGLFVAWNAVYSAPDSLRNTICDNMAQAHQECHFGSMAGAISAFEV